MMWCTYAYKLHRTGVEHNSYVGLIRVATQMIAI
jgi:hypothetical protein